MSNSRLDKFIKKKTRCIEIDDEPDLLSSTPKPTPKEDYTSLWEMFEEGKDPSWLSNPNHPKAKQKFNLFNVHLHGERDLADGVAILAAKGTTFDDKRENCIAVAQEIADGKNTGEILLKPEPENPYDPNAVAIYDAKENRMLGYIPRANDINLSYAYAIEIGKFMGGYIVHTKTGKSKGNTSTLLLIATGWKN